MCAEQCLEADGHNIMVLDDEKIDVIVNGVLHLEKLMVLNVRVCEVT